MKKCPYCGMENKNEAERCEKCFAGFPHEEPKKEEPLRVSRKKRSELTDGT